jgi:hypothetical protein
MIDFEKKSSEEKSGDTQLDDARTYALASDNEPSFNGLISTLTTLKLSRVDSLRESCIDINLLRRSFQIARKICLDLSQSGAFQIIHQIENMTRKSKLYFIPPPR